METPPSVDAGTQALELGGSPVASSKDTKSMGRQAILTSLPAHTFDSLYIKRPRVWLLFILTAFVISAFSYAVYTPDWQAPDEPAHYNYIANIANRRSLPVLLIGDYNQFLIQKMLDSRFETPAPVSALRYESHQPPLYYLLATPIYWVSDGSLFALRIFSIFIGLCSIILLYLCLELVFPKKTMIVVGATAFAALLPMHVALAAAVTNDGLAEMLILASMLVLLHWMRGRFYVISEPTNSVGNITVLSGKERQQLLLLGLLFGLGMLTKVYAYIALPIALAMIVLVVWAEPRLSVLETGVSGPLQSTQSFWRGVKAATWTALPATALAALWWIRNHNVYGGLDLLGLKQHGLIVIGQARTEDWILSNGWLAYIERAMTFTFQSFWGVFGWMGVFMDQRIYTAFLLFTGVIFLGVLWATVRMISGRPDADMDLFQLTVLAMFGLMIVAVTLAYIWYNIEFVQHQGRYFFWGLLPLSTIVALGWREVMQPLQGIITAVFALFTTVGLAMVGYTAGAMNKWTILTTGVIAMLLLAQPILLLVSSERSVSRLPKSVQRQLLRPNVLRVNRGIRAFLWAIPFILLFELNLLIPKLYIIPQLVW